MLLMNGQTPLATHTAYQRQYEEYLDNYLEFLQLRVQSETDMTRAMDMKLRDVNRTDRTLFEKLTHTIATHTAGQPNPSPHHIATARTELAAMVTRDALLHLSRMAFTP